MSAEEFDVCDDIAPNLPRIIIFDDVPFLRNKIETVACADGNVVIVNTETAYLKIPCVEILVGIYREFW